MSTLYFTIGDHLRRTIDGKPDLCPCCESPRRFAIGTKHEIDHPCSDDPFDDGESEEDEDDSDVYTDDDDMLDLGFAMREMSTNTDYGGVIE